MHLFRQVEFKIHSEKFFQWFVKKSSALLLVKSSRYQLKTKLNEIQKDCRIKLLKRVRRWRLNSKNFVSGWNLRCFYHQSRHQWWIFSFFRGNIQKMQNFYFSLQFLLNSFFFFNNFPCTLKNILYEILWKDVLFKLLENENLRREIFRITFSKLICFRNESSQRYFLLGKFFKLSAQASFCCFKSWKVHYARIERWNNDKIGIWIINFSNFYENHFLARCA